MRVRVKICGITELSVARVATKAGADALGFVFARSVRQITPAAAARISNELDDRILRVAVFRNPGRAEIEAVLDEFDPDLIQADFQARAAVPKSVRFLPVIHDGAPIPADDRLQQPECILYDSADSGTGGTTDWSAARRLADGHRIVLAGGLNPENVAHAIEAVRPFAVDVSSGVEIQRGMKDPDLIRSFIAAVNTQPVDKAVRS